MMKFLEAVLILSGMIIGVGMFGIPFSFARAGFWLGMAELFILTVVVWLLHSLYGEIVLNTQSSHRLPGYIKLYLGTKLAALSWFSAFFGIVGTLLAYIVVDAVFLQNIFKNLLPQFNEFWWAVISVLIGAVIISLPLKKEAFIGGVLAIFEIGILVVFILLLAPHISVGNVGGFSPANIFLPYGVLLFSLSGGIIIPDIVEILGRRKKEVRLSIGIGTLVPAILYALFAFAVVGSVGNGVSEETIAGLKSVLGERAVILGSVVGFLAVFTSFIALGFSFRELLRLDFKTTGPTAWFLAVAVPFIFYILGFKNFIIVIGAVGAIAVALDSALIIVAHNIMLRRQGRSPSVFSYTWKWALYAMFLIGALAELYKFLL